MSVRSDVTAQDASLFNPAVTPTQSPPVTPEAAAAPAEKPPVDGLKISSQSWRRGGLGSKALVTFTLRNDNDYAVKDIAISCAFARRDGSHLTDRTQIIHDTVHTKSRRTFARMLVGFVNISANQAKCSPGRGQPHLTGICEGSGNFVVNSDSAAPGTNHSMAG